MRRSRRGPNRPWAMERSELREVDAVGREVTARMFFDDDGVAKGYILGTGQEIDGESQEGQTSVADIYLPEKEEKNIGELPWDFYGGDKLVLGDWER